MVSPESFRLRRLTEKRSGGKVGLPCSGAGKRLQFFFLCNSRQAPTRYGLSAAGFAQTINSYTARV